MYMIILALVHNLCSILADYIFIFIRFFLVFFPIMAWVSFRSHIKTRISLILGPNEL